MNKLVIGSVALAAMIAGPAIAADMPLKAPPPIAVFSWTGCYVGMQIGYKAGWSRYTATGNINGVAVPPAGDLTPRFNVIGGLGGGEIGCNYQVGNWVWGIEVDGSWVAASGQANDIPPFNTAVVNKLDERWQAMARGRIGYAQDKWLWYVTAGGTWAGLDVSTFIPATPAVAAIERHSRGGWVAGFGTEYAVAYGWSVKWETLYTDYGTFTSHSFNAAAFNERTVRYSEWITRFGLNYRFDWYSPVVAKY